MLTDLIDEMADFRPWILSLCSTSSSTACPASNGISLSTVDVESIMFVNQYTSELEKIHRATLSAGPCSTETLEDPLGIYLCRICLACFKILFAVTFFFMVTLS